MKYYGLALTCPLCKKSATLQLFDFSADGELRFTLYCFDCKEVVIWTCFASELIHRALEMDFKEILTKSSQQPKALLPPIKPKPPKPTKLTDADKKMERDMGIEPSEDL